MNGDMPDDLFRSGGEQGRPRDDDGGDGDRHAGGRRDDDRAVGRQDEGWASTMPVLTNASVARGVSHHRAGSPSPSEPSRGARVLPVLAVSLALLVGLAAGQLVATAASSPAPTASATASPSASVTPADPPWDGPQRLLPPKGITATCTAPATLDTQGRSVTYGPHMVLDDRPDTAWRCNGDGVGQKLIFTFPQGATLVGVGLVNGYSKTEGTSSYYSEYRRVTSVRWDLPDGSWFVQNLSENVVGLQQIMIPPSAVTGQVRMTILATTKPGRPGQETRDAVLISRVAFYTKG